MKTNLILASSVSALILGAGTAMAGGSEGAIGVGAEMTLSNFNGMSVNYDAGKFHVGGFFGLADPAGPDNTDIDLGGRFFYHIHTTSMADFGVGGSVGLELHGNPAPVDDTTLMSIEPGFQIRAFLGSNVALSFTGGIAIGVVDADGVELGGQFNGIAGVHYYFY
jgi:hypothetical protein